MAKFIKKISEKAGTPPGTLIPIHTKKHIDTKITVINYTEKEYEENEIETISDCFRLKDTASVSWINVDGINNIELLETIGSHFDVHSLTLEDVLNTEQRPKLEDFDNYLYIVLKMLSFDDTKKEIKSEQVSLILGNNFIISFQEQPGDVFENIRERIRNHKGKIRKMGNDYLAYALIDAIVDNYFIVLEGIGEKIETMENTLISNPETKMLQTIHHLKRNLLFLRKSIWPLRELINGLQKDESKLVKETTSIYLRDVYDHTIQIIDTIETFRDMVSGLLDIYLSSLSNKMNDVMKVLTIFAAIFIPLTFIAGIYGMNFKFMPELEWKWAYPAIWGIMLSLGTGMIYFFKKKKWF